jgi:hypothetical protein
MDVLNSLFQKARSLDFLQPLPNRSITQRISLYADDVVLFIKPCEEEMKMATAMLNKFGEASGLITNLNKSCVIPIRCGEEKLSFLVFI